MFQGEVLLITGGTGSFGNAVLRAFLNSDIGEIRIFSRDEKKQDDQRKFYRSNKLKYYVGDVRDYSSVLNATRGVDYVFHAAALKQVPSCEFHPMEAVKTNVNGTENVLEAAIMNGVRRVVCLSTDKAVYPINAMGISKAMMEKVMVAKSRNVDPARTAICCTRYGNVMASRGSVIPLFVEQVRRGQPITITDPAMTRFMMTLEEAVELVSFAFKQRQHRRHLHPEGAGGHVADHRGRSAASPRQARPSHRGDRNAPRREAVRDPVEPGGNERRRRTSDGISGSRRICATSTTASSWSRASRGSRNSRITTRTIPNASMSSR